MSKKAKAAIKAARKADNVVKLSDVHRQRVREARMIYEAAQAGRRTSHWRTSSLDATSEILGSSAKLRNIARDMVRNNAIAARGKALICGNTVGAGIVPRVEGVSKAVRAKILEHFETTAIDADGLNNLYGIQSMALGAVVESGEVLIRYRPRQSGDGLPLPFQLQVLEADYLDESRNGTSEKGNRIIGGIEFDQIGRRVGYWLFPEHPGSTNIGGRVGAASTFVPAQNIAHIYRVDRPGQLRGVTWFAPVIMRIRDFADLTDAQLVRQKIAACFAAFITKTEAYQGTDADIEAGSNYPTEAFEPGMIEHLREGEAVTFASPPTTADFPSYSDVTIREIAVGLGITPFALSGDLSRVNFSAGRLGWIEFQRNIDAWRWLMLMPQMMDRIAAWTNQSMAVAQMPKAARFAWSPPRREMIDPATEVTAARDAIRAGLSTRSAEVRSLGYDPLEVDAENAADAKRADDLELVYDSDPRKTNARGQEQPSQAPAPEPPAAPADPAA